VFKDVLTFLSALDIFERAWLRYLQSASGANTRLRNQVISLLSKVALCYETESTKMG